MRFRDRLAQLRQKIEPVPEPPRFILLPTQEVADLLSTVPAVVVLIRLPAHKPDRRNEAFLFLFESLLICAAYRGRESLHATFLTNHHTNPHYFATIFCIRSTA